MNPVENLAIGLFCGIILSLPVGYAIGWQAAKTKLRVYRRMLKDKCPSI